jgi:hypothetical protein
MNKKFMSLVLLLATAIASGYATFLILQKAGFEGAFDFDLEEDIEKDIEMNINSKLFLGSIFSILAIYYSLVYITL